MTPSALANHSLKKCAVTPPSTPIGALAHPNASMGGASMALAHRWRTDGAMAQLQYLNRAQIALVSTHAQRGEEHYDDITTSGLPHPVRRGHRARHNTRGSARDRLANFFGSYARAARSHACEGQGAGSSSEGGGMITLTEFADTLDQSPEIRGERLRRLVEQLADQDRGRVLQLLRNVSHDRRGH